MNAPASQLALHENSDRVSSMPRESPQEYRPHGASTAPQAVQRPQHSSKMSLAETLRRRAAEALGAFFSADGNGSDDPLVDVVRRDPRAASCFIKAVMLFSGVGSVVVCIVCALFLGL
eukprot:gnl/TRDRNA2_/TRDRNA2_137310_c0_seq1.p2 gnl/TRDRNA2_/TRDRNA2_137310_c0~~gnl/TRDRNA2_/TRDRNA2_137310_c0_seq1.p2  ORF type:complete len:118 (-),score=22.97 gnl/TRDRNA2_/TRDRNA2_137310_c0_seq1:14-367(-)